MKPPSSKVIWSQSWTTGSPAWAGELEQMISRNAFLSQTHCDSMWFRLWYCFQFCLSYAYTQFSFKLFFWGLVPPLNGLWNVEINTPAYVPWKYIYTKDCEVLSVYKAYKCLLYTFIGKRNFTVFSPCTVQIALKCEKTISVIMFLKLGAQKPSKSQV